MSTDIDLIGEIFDDIEVIDYVGYDNVDIVYTCKCLKCGAISEMTASELINDKKACQNCKSYKFDLETSQVIYDMYTIDNLTQIAIAKKYDCSRQAIASAIKRITNIGESITT